LIPANGSFSWREYGQRTSLTRPLCEYLQGTDPSAFAELLMLFNQKQLSHLYNYCGALEDASQRACCISERQQLHSLNVCNYLISGTQAACLVTHSSRELTNFLLALVLFHISAALALTVCFYLHSGQSFLKDIADKNYHISYSQTTN